MATKIIHKKSSTASSVPAAGVLEPGELAINLADAKLYTETTGGAVIEIAADQTGAEIKAAYQAEANAFTDALFTKLAGIETAATADQTGAQIKALYEAETNAFTDALFTKLNAIEASATADQTGAEIKALYEAETSAFTDALFTKLNAIEASADVTDTTNVVAALTAGSNVAIAADGTISSTDTNTTYSVGDGGLTTNDFTNADHSKLDAIEASATADQTGAEIKAAYEAETSAFTDAQFTKLAGIETSATADQTKADIEGLGIELPAANLTGTIAAARLDTATTQAESDDSTKIATTAYVVDKITTLIGGAPSTLNDLNELAAAINDDADYNTTLTTALGTKLPKAGGQMTGNITMSSTETVDGRDLSVDGAKLDLIEASATADQTDAEIRAAVEAASDSNVFTDADHTKLNGVATSANNYTHPNHSGEVTSSADGATVISDNTVDEANLKVSNTPTNGYFLSAQSGNAGGLTWAEVSASDATKLPLAGGAMTGAITTNSTFDGRDVATDGTKLDSIATNANNYVHPNHSGEVTSSADGATVVASNVIDADNLKVTGNGTTSQFLRSDGDGTFTWATPTDTNTVYSLPLATNTLRGGIELFSNTDQTVAPNTVTATAGRTYGLQLNSSNQAMVNVPWTDTNTVYTHPSHPGDDASVDTGVLSGATVISDLDFNITTDTLGHVTDANATVATRNLTLANLGYTGATNANNTVTNATHTGEVTGSGALTIAANVVDADNLKVTGNGTTSQFLRSDGDGTFTWATPTDTVYTLPLATNTVRGGIELFSNTDQSVAANTVSTTAGRTYGVQLNSANQAVVNVPWSDTDTNTTYSVGDGGLTQNNFTDADHTKLNNIAVSANNYVHPNHSGDVTSTADGATVIADNVVDEANLKVSNAPTNGYMLTAQSGNTGGLTWAAAPTDTNTTYTAGAGLTLTGTAFSHTDSSSQASVNNSGRTYIQDITLDTYGHITGIVSATETVTNTDTNTTYSADGNYGMTLSGTAFRLEDDRRRNSTSTDIYSGNTHDYTFYDASHGIRWYTAGAEEMRLENDGDLHVDGNITAYSTTVSDERLKTDIKPIENALGMLDHIGGYTFNYIKDNKPSAGVIAQEVEKVLPSAVKDIDAVFHGEAGETHKTVEYDQLIGVLIAAVKELKAEVEELKNHTH